jgi:WD40 repeat protein/biotin carboxyl carrier protein
MWRFLAFLICLAGITVAILWATGSLPIDEAEAGDPAGQPDNAASGERIVVKDPLMGGDPSTTFVPPPRIARSGRLFDPVTVNVATVTVIREVEISSRLDGQLEKIFVNLGQPVRRGELLALLEDSLAQHAVALQQIKAESQQAVKAAEAAYNAAEEIVRRDQQAGLAVTETEKLMHRYQRDKAFFDWNKAKEDQRYAERELRKVQRELELHEIRSRFSGHVMKVNKQEGEAVKQGEPIFRIANLDRLRVEGTVEAHSANLIVPGMRALIELEYPSRSIKELRGHTGTVTGLAVTPDGRYLVSCGEDQHVLVWDWEHNRLLAALRDDSHRVEAYAVACGPMTEDPATRERTYPILVAFADARARLWLVTVSPQGRLVSAEPKVDFKGGHRGAIRALALSPGGEWCATGGDDRQICLWRVSDGKLLYQLRAVADRLATAHQGAVTTLHFTADPALHLISAGTDNTLKKWKLGVDAAQLVRTMAGRTGDVSKLGVSADGRRVLFDIGEELRIYDLNTWEMHGSIQSRRQGHFAALALFSPSGRMVLTTAANGRVQLWTTPASLEQTAFLRHGYEHGFKRNTPLILGVLASSLAPAGHLLVPAFAATAAEQPVAPPTEPDDTEELPLGLTSVPELWPLNAFEIRHFQTPEAANVTCGVFAPDESVVFTAGADKVIRVWRLPSAEEREYPLEAVITYVGKQVISGTNQVQIRAEFDNPPSGPRQMKPGYRVGLTLYPETAPKTPPPAPAADRLVPIAGRAHPIDGGFATRHTSPAAWLQ